MQNEMLMLALETTALKEKVEYIENKKHEIALLMYKYNDNEDILQDILERYNDDIKNIVARLAVIEYKIEEYVKENE